MKQIFLFFLLSINFCNSQTNLLSKIVEDDKVGYINSDGKIVIQPIYENGSDFSENIAAVRKGSYFGYINSNNKTIIPFIYDYAFPFYNGIAKVFKDGKETYINHKNEIVIDSAYKIQLILNKTKAIVKSKSGKQGIYDFIKQKIIIDTIYGRINYSKNNLFVVENNSKVLSNDAQIGLIDSIGNFIVPFGKYYEIRNFQDDYTLVRFKDSLGRKNNGAIDKTGKLLFNRLQDGYNSYIDGDYYNGLAKIVLYKDWLPKKENKNTYLKEYQGFIDYKGKIVLNDTMNKFVGDFKKDFTYIVKFNREIEIINKDLKKLNEIPCESSSPTNNEEFQILKNKNGYSLFDYKATPLIEDFPFQIYDYDKNEKLIFFTTKDTINNPDNDDFHYGIVDLKSKILINNIDKAYNNYQFNNGSFHCYINHLESYVNNQGKIVWQEKTQPLSTIKKYNIDYKTGNSYYALELDHSQKDTLDSWRKYYSFSKKNNLSNFGEKDKVSIVIDTLQKIVFNNKYEGYKLFVINNTKNKVVFDVVDNNLYITLQALNKNGIWKDIESFGSSFCGNSYYKINLPEKKYWEFEIPNFEGGFKTKIRAKLKKFKSNNSNIVQEIYSNEIDATINPSQFIDNIFLYN